MASSKMSMYPVGENEPIGLQDAEHSLAQYDNGAAGGGKPGGLQLGTESGFATHPMPNPAPSPNNRVNRKQHDVRRQTLGTTAPTTFGANGEGVGFVLVCRRGFSMGAAADVMYPREDGIFLMINIFYRESRIDRESRLAPI